MENRFKSQHLVMISWLILPVLFVWLSTNYLIGINRKTVWEIENNPRQTEVQTAPVVEAPAEISPVHWQQTGLITLWFDDAWESQYARAYPLLAQRHLSGALAVPTKMVGFDDYMSWSQIKTLQYKGWEITSHTRNHSCQPEDLLSSTYIETELHGAQDDLQRNGLRAQQFVTPCGADSPLVTEVAKKYYLSLRTSYGGFNPLPVEDPYSLHVQAIRWTTTPEDVQGWIAQAAADHSWLILMFHQIEDKQEEYATTPQRFSQFIDLVQQSQLPVVLPTQALELITDETASPSASEEPRFTVLPTSLGYVNIREKPFRESAAVGKAIPGDTYLLLEEQSGWAHIASTAAHPIGWIAKKYLTAP